jgi:hypothetical protein
MLLLCDGHAAAAAAAAASCPLQVAAAIAAQLCRVNTNSRYLSSELNAYCEELTHTLPDPLKVSPCFWNGCMKELQPVTAHRLPGPCSVVALL